MTHNRRSSTCGALNSGSIGQTVTLNGWVHRNRDHGGVHFINIRDRYGITQAVMDEDAPEDLQSRIAGLKLEDCIALTGIVRSRPEGMKNSAMSTGEIEVSINSMEILNACASLPFMIDSEDEANENLRLKYRYLDLRSKGMQERLKMRHETTWAIRKYLTEEDFWEVETPTLIKSTPEGARDYLVPSRVHAGRFYALPQSPQLYKQILMAGGTDRYYQIARCYRDEDPRGDRQPEFTQVDLEMSFAGREDVLEILEAMMVRLFKEVLGVETPLPFPRLAWKAAMEDYGTDKPDRRFAMKIQDFTAFVPQSEFGVFKSALEAGGTVRAIVVKGVADSFSRKKISNLEEIARQRGAKGLAWMKVTETGLDGGISRFFSDQQEAICTTLKAEKNDLILLAADEWTTALTVLGALRVHLGKALKLIDSSRFEFCWILDFPLFEEDEENGGWTAVHHMFSMPQEAFLEGMEENTGEVIGNLYDLVLNGNELGSGSVRIHDPAIQSRIFDIVGFPKEEAEQRFGFLLEALRFGAPPHAGFAFGLDRLLMVMAQVNTIRDVIAFPKNTQGVSPMDESPSEVDESQLRELHLKTSAH